MRIGALDTESTGATNETYANPFTESNRLCYCGMWDGSDLVLVPVEYHKVPYGKALDRIRDWIDSIDMLVLFNAKHDLHWLRRYGITNWQTKKIWDCQTVEFLLKRQSSPYPSLEESLSSRSLPAKLDVVKNEYWNKGFDTDQVPKEILEEYLTGDVEGTLRLYQKQGEEVREKGKAFEVLVSLSNQDTLVLEEMEWNGLPYDLKESFARSQHLEGELVRLDTALGDLCGVKCINWSSGDQLSVVLYGGRLMEDYRESYIFKYKDGREKQKERWAQREHIFPAVAVPLPKSEVKKSTSERPLYKTDEQTLRKIKANKKGQKIIQLLLERAKIEKLKSTYYDGFPKLHKFYQWEDNILHSQLVQVVAATGRLASNKPNEQNIPDPVRQLVKTRYG